MRSNDAILGQKMAVSEWFTRSLTAKDVFRPETKAWDETPDRQYSIDPIYLEFCKQGYQDAYWELDQAIQDREAQKIEITGVFEIGHLIPRASGVLNGEFTFENRALQGFYPKITRDLPTDTSTLYTWKKPEGSVGWVRTTNGIYLWYLDDGEEIPTHRSKYT